MPFGGPADCAYYGAREREGRYVVTVIRAGFGPQSSTVTVGRDECHVLTERRTYTLQAS